MNCEDFDSLGMDIWENQNKKECETMENPFRGLKKRYTLTPKPQGQLLQVSDPVSTIVAGTGQGTQPSDRVSPGSSPNAGDSSPRPNKGGNHYRFCWFFLDDIVD